jgi:hypothetical protein
MGARGMVLAGYCPVLKENCRPRLAEPSSSCQAKTEANSFCSLFKDYNLNREQKCSYKNYLFSQLV